MSDSPQTPQTPQTIDVAHVARLARLALDPDEHAQLERDLRKILAYVDELRAVDVRGVAPMTHPLPFTRELRPDVPAPAMPQATALAAAPAQDGEAFIVPRVV